ncbi:Ras-related GTP binding A family protein [Cardiosporidium cionae]|uniref:Ras-related GTP binding A family protein n=1 Tax=Cardiosporidium cionae TaxID=476202 RepID=A0ABQ7JDA6_9APIC|nr:Ras-related GTP binding A family protein [Cardiosporidium cionae]|eukprot:KAF8821944.1 Ras-related GTP binding A family protein [Cardiosporidium cionae]
MQTSNKKVLLMGRAGAGKTSMRSIIFANYLSRETKKLTATNNVEHSNVKFLGNLTLSLWDCGGQDTFMENYFESQREHIFTNAEVLIYVLEVRSATVGKLSIRPKEIEKDFQYMQNALDSIKQFSPKAKIFCLVHKMDKVINEEKRTVEKFYEDELSKEKSGLTITFFGTSIWDETLFNAWSKIVYYLVPNVNVLTQHLKHCCEICHADEVVIFEKYTFLVIAHASVREHKDSHRFEKISNICKQFKLACVHSRVSSTFEVLLVQNPSFRVFTEHFTDNTYIMLIVSDSAVEPAALMCNIDYARTHFSKMVSLRFGGPV